MLTPQRVMNMTTALVDPTRFRLVQRMVHARERYWGELAWEFLITQATVSQHGKV